MGGGRHEGLGTHNRIVPLGDGYLEILAVADPGEAARSQLGRALATRIAQAAEGLMGWAVAVDDVVSVAERLGTPVNTIARQGLSARLTGVLEAMAAPFLPFFIARDPGIENPGGSGDAGGIEWIEVAGHPDQLSAWLGGARLPVRVVEGAPAVRAVSIGGRILCARPRDQNPAPVQPFLGPQPPTDDGPARAGGRRRRPRGLAGRTRPG